MLKQCSCLSLDASSVQMQLTHELTARLIAKYGLEDGSRLVEKLEEAHLLSWKSMMAPA